MNRTRTSILKDRRRLGLTLALANIVLLATWMGDVNGGYFVRDWATIALLLAALLLVGSLAGLFRGLGSRQSITALGLFAGYAAWTSVSLLWSSDLGDAWFGAAQTLLYLLAFVVSMAILTSGGSRRWVLVASVLGPAVEAAFTLWALVSGDQSVFKDGSLVGTVGYHNGEAAFLLVPFWVAVYLAGSRCVNPVVRGLVLAGATLCIEVAVLAQSRGALVAMAMSLPVFFALSGQRLRGLLALIPVSAALLASFSDLNEVYLAFLNEEDPAVALNHAIPIVWMASVTAGLYGLLWGVADRWWKPPSGMVRAVGVSATLLVIVALVIGAVALGERVGSPLTWSGQKWEAFKNDDVAGQEQNNRYLNVSGSGRYTLWEVAWEDFMAHPLLGIGTHNYEATYYQLREQRVGYVRQPHMLPLEVLAERGIVGGALFFGFLAVCLATGLRQRFTYLNAEGKAMVGAAIAAIAYWFVHSSAEWFWQLPAVTLSVVIYLAVLAAPWRHVKTEVARWSWRAGSAAVAVLTIVLIAPLYIADRYLAQSYATTDPRVALETVERAQRFNPVDPQLPQREAELAMQVSDWPRVEKAYNRAIQLNPRHYAPYALLAEFHEQRGEYEEALESYRKALNLNPLDKKLSESVNQLQSAGRS